MRSPDWKNTAVIVNYDDSDGWYDHAYSGVTNPSLSPADNLTNTSLTVSDAPAPRASAARARRPTPRRWPANRAAAASARACRCC